MSMSDNPRRLVPAFFCLALGCLGLAAGCDSPKQDGGQAGALTTKDQQEIEDMGNRYNDMYKDKMKKR